VVCLGEFYLGSYIRPTVTDMLSPGRCLLSVLSLSSPKTFLILPEMGMLDCCTIMFFGSQFSSTRSPTHTHNKTHRYELFHDFRDDFLFETQNATRLAFLSSF
jgi:hypothetical protein